MGRRRSILLVATGALVTGLVILVVAIPVALTHRQDLPAERFYGNVAVRVVSGLLGGNATNPVANNPQAISAGRAAYTGSCAVCHGAKGDGRGTFGTSTYPDATDLTKVVAERSDAQLFWIVKNGLGFTAMPAFGSQYRDDQIWGLVAFMRVLQRGGPTAIVVDPPTDAQLLAADPRGDRVARGAAIYFAHGCHLCHGAEGEAPGSLAIRGRIETEIVRKGATEGMPAYGKDLISDAELADLEAYLLRFAAIPSSPD